MLGLGELEEKAGEEDVDARNGENERGGWYEPPRS